MGFFVGFLVHQKGGFKNLQICRDNVLFIFNRRFLSTQTLFLGIPRIGITCNTFILDKFKKGDFLKNTNLKHISLVAFTLSILVFSSECFSKDSGSAALENPKNKAFSKDETTVTADLDIVGRVPVIVQSSITLNKSALVFRPREKVRDRVIGQIHLKFNIPLSGIQISSNHPNGIPSNDFGEKYPFGPYGFEVKIKDCPGLDPNATQPIAFSGIEYAPVDIGSKAPLANGIQATCNLVASWDGAENDSPAQDGRYSIDYQVSLVPVN